MIKKNGNYNKQMLKYLDQVDNIFRVDIINNLEKPLWRNGCSLLRGAIITTSYQVHRALLNLYYRELERRSVKNYEIVEINELKDIDFTNLK